MAFNRLLIVSNRLPVAARLDGGEVRLSSTSGGLATGLAPWHEQSDGLWIGWPGDVSRFSRDQRSDLECKLRDRGIVGVYLSPDEIKRYYHGFSNRVVWPLFHYLVDRVPLDAAGWDAYRQVNEKFADAVVHAYRPGDDIWVHDYQLMLVPALVRARLPKARIGFFLHIPFPASEVFRILPWRHDLLQGLLGADLVGFHTFAYLRHFVASLVHVDGVEPDVDRIRVGKRLVKLGVFPMGVDAESFGTLAHDPDVAAEVEAIRKDAGGRRIVLGVDRLDYTKGIPRRLLAIERLLTRHPRLRESIRYVQVAVPSRGEVDSYQAFRRQLEETVGRINGECTTLRSTPIHYMHRSVSRRQLTALYCAADVMVVTPLRDGMNLVAKEFVASRVDEDGVLVLSEFAGAAAELGSAVVVNPYDVDAVASAIETALDMPPADRRVRMQNLRRRVLAYDIHRWAEHFIESLRSVRIPAKDTAVPEGQHDLLAAAVARMGGGTRLRLLLDYDGTLVPFAPSPELAVPDEELLELLQALADSSGIELQIVSGRSRETLDAWFGHLPASLWAEHGLWYRPAPQGPWEPVLSVTPDWMTKLYPIFQQFADSTPGSLVESKSASLAWHYRMADPEFGARQAHELRMLLGDALSNQPVEVLEGRKVIEVRLRGVSKAIVAHRMLPGAGANPAILAIGDDRTDEDLFNALPESSLTVAVGQHPTRARYRLPDYRAVRRLLVSLAATAAGEPLPQDLGAASARRVSSFGWH